MSIFGFRGAKINLFKGMEEGDYDQEKVWI
jgi:hypothetical protein